MRAPRHALSLFAKRSVHLQCDYLLPLLPLLLLLPLLPLLLLLLLLLRTSASCE